MTNIKQLEEKIKYVHSVFEELKILDITNTFYTKSINVLSIKTV